MANLEKISTLTDQRIQFWLRTIEEQDLLNGMLGVNAEIRQRVMDNLAPRAKVALRNYLEDHANLDQRIVAASLARLETALDMVH
jgi:flagellar motor switch protein FliG